jgi:hypothetical protein
MGPQHQKAKWETFTYIEKEARKIAKLFKDAQLKQRSKRKTQYKTK